MDRQTDGHKAISWHCFAEGGFYYLNIIQKNLYGLHSQLWSGNHFQTSIIHDLDLLTPKSIGHILDSWGASV